MIHEPQICCWTNAVKAFLRVDCRTTKEKGEPTFSIAVWTHSAPRTSSQDHTSRLAKLWAVQWEQRNGSPLSDDVPEVRGGETNDGGRGRQERVADVKAIELS